MMDCSTVRPFLNLLTVLLLTVSLPSLALQPRVSLEPSDPKSLDFESHRRALQSFLDQHHGSSLFPEQSHPHSFHQSVSLDMEEARSSLSSSNDQEIRSAMPKSDSGEIGSSSAIVTAPSVPKARRIPCSSLLAKIDLTHRAGKSLVVQGLHGCNVALSDSTQHQIEDVDKYVAKSLSLIGFQFKPGFHGLSMQTFAEFLNCAVDEKDRTFLMKIVQKGLVETMKNPVTFKLKNEKLTDLRDADGNSLLHLAVDSQNYDVVSRVLNEALGSDGEIAFRMLEEKNNDGIIPRDLAAKNLRSDIVTVLQAYHTTASTLLTAGG